MRVAYGDSAVLRCSVQLAYDRFFTKFHYDDSLSSVENTPFEGQARESLNKPWWLNERIPRGQGGLALGATTRRQGGNY